MILDLFAGPGGWSEGLRALGLADIGIEWDGAACEPRAAAGHLTIRADVSLYPTEPFAGRVVGLIASPPCPTFSAAGKGEGVNEFPYLHSFADQVAATGWFSPWSHHAWSDPRTPLVLEPLRWVEALRPEWVACEQVPAVMPLWSQYAAIWRAQGYSTWAGVLNAADFGVPQTRRRAFCIAHRTRVATPPEPTHCKGGALTAFGSLLPWVSMADALGWGMTEKPSVTLVAGSNRQGGADPLDGGSGARATLRREREKVLGYRRTRGAGMSERHGDRPDTPMNEPAPTLTSKSRSDTWTVDRRTNSRAAGGGQAPTALVLMSEPAPTFTGKSGSQWVLRPGLSASQPNRRVYTDDEPAPTVAFGHDAASWCWERPSTCLMGDPRVAAPGYRGGHDDRSTTMMADAVRITLQEALTLQSFDPGYPVQGNKTKQFEQVGNAVPPRLAAAVLTMLVGPGAGQVDPDPTSAHSCTALPDAPRVVTITPHWPERSA